MAIARTIDWVSGLKVFRLHSKSLAKEPREKYRTKVVWSNMEAYCDCILLELVLSASFKHLEAFT